MRIIVATHNENSGMVTLGDHDKVMQVTEIAVVMRKQNAILLNGVSEMDRVVIAA